MTRDGIYQDRNGQQASLFKAGERYIRDGTSNALFTGDEHQVGLLMKPSTTGPPVFDAADVLTFEGSLTDIADAARQLLRKNDDVPLQLLLGTTEATVRSHVHAQEWSDVTRVLDRLVVLGCVYLGVGAEPQAKSVLGALMRVFEIGFDESDVGRQTTDAYSPRLWLEVTARAEVLGALALRLRRWDFVREVGLWCPPQVRDPQIANWIRAAMTTRSFESWPKHDDDDRRRPSAIPEVAAELAETLPQTSEDIRGDAGKLRESIGQFDFAVCLLSIAKLKNASPRVLMTDGVRVAGREGLSQFVLRHLTVQGPARTALFPLPDDDLATSLRQFESSLVASGSHFGWYGETEDFIERNLPNADSSG